MTQKEHHSGRKTKHDENHEVIDVFPQSVSMLNMPFEHTNLQDVFNTVIKPRNTEVNTRDKKLRHHHNNENVLDLYPILHQVRDDILEGANFIYREILNKRSTLKLTNAWFNECDVGGSQNFHNHCNSTLSGTYYINTDKNTHITFESPYHHPSNTCNSIQDECARLRPNRFGYNYHQNYCTIPVEKNMCLFWESYLHHGYVNNQTPNRLSLSFNLLPDQVSHNYKI